MLKYSSYTEADAKRDKRIGLLSTVAYALPQIYSPIAAKRGGEALKRNVLSLDGDALLRNKSLSRYEAEAQAALGKLSGNPNTPIFPLPPNMPSNSMATPPNKLYPHGSIVSGIPSRAVLAHEFGHINRFKDPKIRRRHLALAYSRFGAVPVSYGLGKLLGLSDEQALAGSATVTAGIEALRQRNTLREEFEASKDAIRTLRKLNKTITDPAARIDSIKARKALRWALGTYKKAFIPNVALAAAAPLGIYGLHKLYKAKRKSSEG